MAAGEPECPVGQVVCQALGHVTKGGEVVGVEVNAEAIRNDRPIGAGHAIRLHRSLDPSLQLDGLQTRSEESGGWPLEESFKEPLQGGERAHLGGRV